MRKTVLCLVAFCVAGCAGYSEQYSQQAADPQAVMDYLILHQLREMEQRDAEEQRKAAETARYAAATDAEIQAELDRYCPPTQSLCYPPSPLREEAHRRGLFTYAARPNRGTDCVIVGDALLSVLDCQ
jgi:hypothetical protein